MPCRLVPRPRRVWHQRESAQKRPRPQEVDVLHRSVTRKQGKVTSTPGNSIVFVKEREREKRGLPGAPPLLSPKRPPCRRQRPASSCRVSASLAWPRPPRGPHTNSTSTPTRVKRPDRGSRTNDALTQQYDDTGKDMGNKKLPSEESLGRKKDRAGVFCLLTVKVRTNSSLLLSPQGPLHSFRRTANSPLGRSAGPSVTPLAPYHSI